ncbi:hypothetical protein AB6A40_008520, partial [Gnathostoma spinigerum]
MKLSNKFIVTPAATSCPSFTVEVQGENKEASFTVDPSKTQLMQSWDNNLGDFGLLHSTMGYLQCARLGGG